jgi:uncharacterized ubiquitin-like protein YukD
MNYVSPLILRLDIRKFKVILIEFQSIKCQSLSFFRFVIREKQQLFGETSRLLAYPLADSVALYILFADCNRSELRFFPGLMDQC